ncbi:MAG TPA: putative lipid II flippase FtsW [Myxococcales bacterium]|nr:putative lipid II flippase FtsW [Myxococcales bacterium]
MNASAVAGARVARQRSEQLRPVLRYDPLLLVAVLLLVAFGVVMVYSASAVYAGARLGDPLWFFKRQAMGALIGVLALLATMKLGYRRLEALAVPLLGLSLLLLALVQMPGLGHAAGGARRWIQLGPLTFQPSELAKIALVLWLARSLAKKQERIRLFSVGFLPHLVMLALFGVLLMLEPDFGTAVVLGVVTFALLFVAGARLTWLLAMAGALAPIAAVLIWKSPYRVQRVLTFLDPWKDPRGHGYQTVESLLGFGAGGTLGVGLGESRQKLFFLPAAHTDFILSIVGEELGFAGVAAVLLLFAAIVWRGIRAAYASPDAFGCWAALGLTLLLGVEALVNAGMALALLPTKGMALPFLSYGMSSVIASCAAAGIVLSVSGGAGGFLRRGAGGQR